MPGRNLQHSFAADLGVQFIPRACWYDGMASAFTSYKSLLLSFHLSLVTFSTDFQMLPQLHNPCKQCKQFRNSTHHKVWRFHGILLFLEFENQQVSFEVCYAKPSKQDINLLVQIYLAKTKPNRKNYPACSHPSNERINLVKEYMYIFLSKDQKEKV